NPPASDTTNTTAVTAATRPTAPHEVNTASSNRVAAASHGTVDTTSTNPADATGSRMPSTDTSCPTENTHRRIDIPRLREPPAPGPAEDATLEGAQAQTSDRGPDGSGSLTSDGEHTAQPSSEGPASAATSTSATSTAAEPLASTTPSWTARKSVSQRCAGVPCQLCPAGTDCPRCNDDACPSCASSPIAVSMSNTVDSETNTFVPSLTGPV